MLKNTKKHKKDENIVQEDKKGNTDCKTDVKDPKKFPIWCHFQIMKLACTLSLENEGAHNQMSKYKMKTLYSSDPVFLQAKNCKTGVTQRGDFLSKDEVEKRLRAWERTTLVRKRSES